MGRLSGRSRGRQRAQRGGRHQRPTPIGASGLPFLLTLTVVVAMTFWVVGGTAPSVAQSSVSVSTGDFFFDPATVTITVGDTVTWTNVGEVAHTTTSGSSPNPDGIWDSGTLEPGESFSRTFNEAGTFSYFCTIHPTLMSGRVIVEAAEEETTTTTTTTTTTIPAEEEEEETQETTTTTTAPAGDDTTTTSVEVAGTQVSPGDPAQVLPSTGVNGWLATGGIAALLSGLLLVTGVGMRSRSLPRDPAGGGRPR